MIHESYYWKKELLKLAKKLTKRIPYKRAWTDAQNGAFEKEIMIGFYIIRKLIDSMKLTNAIVSTKISGKKYANNGKLVNLQNNHRFDEFYDFENPQHHKFDLKFLNNQIIHSYIFSPQFSLSKKGIENLFAETQNASKEAVLATIDSAEIELTGILFCSDDKRNEFLYEIELTRIIDLFMQIGNCHVTYIRKIFNPNKKDYDLFQSDEVIPIPDEIEELISRSEKKA